MSKGLSFTFSILLLLTTALPFNSFAAPESNQDKEENSKASITDEEFFEEDGFGESEEVTKISDPLEKINRPVYKFNRVIDNVVVEPVARGYRAAIPGWGRERVRSFLKNLKVPLTLFNSVLQGDVDNSFHSFWRFTINSTLGVGGLFDIASYGNLSNREEDFGQTLGVWGMNAGPYIMWPVLGPSNIRDSLGMTGDYFADPFHYTHSWEFEDSRNVLTVIDTREQFLDLLDDIDKTSLDPYATIRSLYIQKRDSDIKNGSYTLKTNK